MSSQWSPHVHNNTEYYDLKLNEDIETEAVAVLHPFGRGQFKELAECMTIPDVLLDELCERHNTTRTSANTWSRKVGGAARSKSRELESSAPKPGGRARALRLRAERFEQSPRRPGHNAHHTKNHYKLHSKNVELSPSGRMSPVTDNYCQRFRIESAMPPESTTTSTVACMTYSDYDHHWPVLPGGISEEDSSDILTDEFSSELPKSTYSCPISRKRFAKTSSLNGVAPVLNKRGSVRADHSDTNPIASLKMTSRQTYTAKSLSLAPHDHTPQNVKSTRALMHNSAAVTGRCANSKEDEPSINRQFSSYNTSFETQRVPLEASLNKEEEDQEWPIDGNTLIFSNLPSYVQRKELIDMVQPFDTITHCRVQRDGDKLIALLRLKKRTACDWVIACFNKKTYRDSSRIVQCNFAMKKNLHRV